MLKKILMLMMCLSLILAPGGFFGQNDFVEAKKSYKSGTKSFKLNDNNTNSNSTIKKDTTPSNSSVKTTPQSKSGGFMKGILFGGLAGLLFGSLFGDLGFLGAILGLLINIIAVYALFMLIRKVYTYFKNQRKDSEYRT
jgi:predicted lipid-binding transport protein (Tim44 family)